MFFVVILIVFEFIKQSNQHLSNHHLYCKSDFNSFIDNQSKLQVGNYLVISWNFKDDDSIEIQINWNQLTWLGIGFCPTMTNCDMVIFNLMDDSVQVLDMFSSGHSYPELDHHNDITIIEQSINQNGYIVKFNRKLSTGDQQDQILERNQKYAFSYAYSPSKQLAYHSYYASFEINLIEGINDIIQPNTGSDNKILLNIHAVILFILWGICADFAILIVRFAKERDNYLKIHSYCFSFINILTIIIFIVMINEHYNQNANKLHLGMSILLLIFLIIQSINGLYVKSKIEPITNQSNSKFLKLWKAHIFFGGIIYIVAKIEIIIGLVEYNSPILLGLTIGWFIILLILRIVFERRRNHKKKLGISRNHQYIPPTKLSDQQQLLLTLLNQNISTIEINQQLPNMIWVIMDNDVFDFSTYQHPAGNFLIQQGKEIGRYFYGGISLESTKIKKHNHSPMAYDMLDARYLGTLVYQFYTIDTSKSREFNSVWTLSDTTKYTYDISLFEFKNQNLFASLELNVNNFGQYFTIQLIKDKRKRQYTQILCMRKPYQQFKEQVLQFYHTMHLNQSSPPKLREELSNSIPLIIKRYNYPKAVTPLIFDLQSSAIVYLEGPFGRGLELKKSMKAVAFVGGTGLLPFLDLLDHLLMKSIYAVLKKTNDSKAEQFFNKDSQLGDDFEFTLNGTFLNEEEFIGREWIRQLYKINQENNLKFFNMKLRYSNGKLDDAIPTIHNRFSQEFVLKELGDFTNQVYICGPPSMNYSLLEIISQSQQNKEKVMVV